jgi:hypothetical protein
MNKLVTSIVILPECFLHKPENKKTAQQLRAVSSLTAYRSRHTCDVANFTALATLLITTFAEYRPVPNRPDR